MTDGSRVKVLQDHIDGIATGACVSVEEGRHTNVRAVSPEFCGTTTAEVHTDSIVVAQRATEADACELAKEALVDAKTEQEFEFTTRKIKVLCH